MQSELAALALVCDLGDGLDLSPCPGTRAAARDVGWLL